MDISKKKFILTADDFGMDESFDRAILKGHKDGFIQAACIAANGNSYEYAMKHVLPKCKDLDLGVHLNIIEGQSLAKCTLLTDKYDCFKHGFVSLLANSCKKAFLSEIEQEFRAQIEKLKNDTDRPIAFINSHVHTHAIPNIFKITAKLAREYGIKFIRTQAEKPYCAPEMPKPVNIIKILLLNYLTAQNAASVKEFELRANDYIIGVGHTGGMSGKAIYHGVKSLDKMQNITVEAIIHPGDDPKSSRFKEFEASLDLDLRESIEGLGFEVSSFSKLLSELHSEEFLYKGV